MRIIKKKNGKKFKVASFTSLAKRLERPPQAPKQPVRMQLEPQQEQASRLPGQQEPAQEQPKGSLPRRPLVREPGP